MDAVSKSCIQSTATTTTPSATTTSASTTSSSSDPQMTPCFVVNQSSVVQNPFSKTSSCSPSSCTSSSSSQQQCADRPSVILAPARLNTSVATPTNKAFVLRPSVLRVADSSSGNSNSSNNTTISNTTNSDNNNSVGVDSVSDNNSILNANNNSINNNTLGCGVEETPSFNNSDAQTVPKDSKVFAFVSLSKEDISPPATTLLQHDIVTKCTPDTTSPVNGDEPPVSSTSDVPATSSDENDSNSQGFVFGENLEHRVLINRSDEKKDTEEADGGVAAAAANECTTSEQIKTDADGALDLSHTESGTPEKAEKRKYEVITGEEDEQNVLVMFCRLYAWETQTSSWKERGRGNLRLNDAMKDDKLCSRIVMRTSGALRVILNAHLISGMKFEMANEHCLRFTNVDGIYLIKGATKDIDQLNSAIDYRLREISKRLKLCPQSPEELSNESLSNK